MKIVYIYWVPPITLSYLLKCASLGIDYFFCVFINLIYGGEQSRVLIYILLQTTQLVYPCDPSIVAASLFPVNMV